MNSVFTVCFTYSGFADEWEGLLIINTMIGSNSEKIFLLKYS